MICWEQRKLGECTEMFNGDRGANYPKDSEMVPDGIPFINAGDLQNGHVNLQGCNKITRIKFYQLGGAKIQQGDILYCLRGTIGKNAIVDDFNEGTVASSLVDIRPKNINGKYLFTVLNSDIEYCQRVLNDEGAAQPNLSARNLADFNIPIPSRTEQEKIGGFFCFLDHLITLHQSKSFGHILEVIVSCTLSWEQRKLGEVANRFDSTRIPISENLRVLGNTPYYGANGIQDYVEGYTHDGEYILIAEDGANDLRNYPTRLVKGRIWVNNHAHVIQGIERYMDNKFINFAMSQVDFESIVVGCGRAKLNAEQLMDIFFKIPNKNEQTNIGRLFESLDYLITLHQLEPFQLIFKAIAYRIIDYAKSKPPRRRKYTGLISFIKCYV